MILGGVAAVFMPRNLETAPFFTDEERAFACMSCFRYIENYNIRLLLYSTPIPFRRFDRSTSTCFYKRFAFFC